ncbi:hypothetical protein Tco_1335717 [Tanacetum coccineum]
MQLRIMRDVQDSRKKYVEKCQFLGDRLVSWSSRNNEHCNITTEAEYIAMSGVVLNSFGCDPAQRLGVERLLAVTNPDTQFCKCCGESSLKTNVDMQSIIWEEFTQGIRLFSLKQARHKPVEEPKEESNPLLITLWTILQCNNNLFTWHLKCLECNPEPLINEAFNKSSYYSQIYLKMVAAITKKNPQEVQACILLTKRATPKKPTTTTPVKQSKPAPSPTKKPSKQVEFGVTSRKKGKGEGDDADLELAIKLSLDPALLPQRQAPVGGVTIRDPVSETTPKLHEVVGKGKAVVSEEQVAHSLIDMSKKKRSTDQFILARRDQTPPDSTTGPSSQPNDDTSDKEIHESSSASDSERTESDTESAAPKGDKDQDEVDTSTVTSGVSIPGSDPVKAHEALAGPDPEPMQEDQTGSDSGKHYLCLLLGQT